MVTPDNIPDDLITTAEAAALLGVTTAAINMRWARGQLTRYERPKRRGYRYSRAEVEGLNQWRVVKRDQ